MAIEDADGSAPAELEGEVEESASGDGVVRGEYTWDEFLRDHGHPGAAEALYERFDAAPGSDRWGEEGTEDDRTLTREDWDRAAVDVSEFLGFHPVDTDEVVGEAGAGAETLDDVFEAFCDPESTPVVKDVYLWEHYKREYYYEPDGSRPRDDEGEIVRFEKEEALGFDPDATENALAHGGQRADELAELVDERTVDVNEELDEDAFFSNADGSTTLVNRYDLEKAVPMEKKTHFREEERYWADKPHSFVVIFHSTKENEKKYYAVQPYLNEIEEDLQEYLTGKLRTSIKYSDESVSGGDEQHRRTVIREEAYSLLDRYDLYTHEESDEPGLGVQIVDRLGIDPTEGFGARLADALGYEESRVSTVQMEGIQARPEPAVLADDAETLTEYQVTKLLYYLQRDFIGYERIDPVKHDINVEDISCDGYNSPVFVYHSDYEQIISNIYHGQTELDDFVVKLAQRSGKGISKRRPQVDATLPDGSRAQLTLGKEVSDHGTNYTIRQFKDVPFTPVDLINWKTFSLDEMAYLWLCIENHKSLIFAGGTASGKTTSLNAVSLFIPSNSKIVSIEDTREVELPQRNWIASVTRPSFSDDDKGDVDEFDLLEAALRQRPDYIVMGEIRGEEGRTAFQVMSTGHTTYTTFHADSVGEVLKRFTTDPINVSKTMFTALDLVSIQSSTRVQGKKVRRNKSLTEINHYDAENDEINVQDVYQWQAETDEFLQMGDSNTLEEIKFDRGWNQETLEDEMFKRQLVLAYLIDRGFNTYTQVAATFQAFINDPETILALMANDELERSLEDLREMESVLIDVDPEKEAMVPRPDPDEEGKAEAARILEEGQELLEQYRGEIPNSVADALLDVQPEADIEVEGGDHTALEEAAEAAAELDGADETDGTMALESADSTDDGDDAGADDGDDAGSDHGADVGTDESTDTSAFGADDTTREPDDGNDVTVAGDEADDGDVAGVTDEGDVAGVADEGGVTDDMDDVIDDEVTDDEVADDEWADDEVADDEWADDDDRAPPLGSVGFDDDDWRDGNDEDDEPLRLGTVGFDDDGSDGDDEDDEPLRLGTVGFDDDDGSDEDEDEDATLTLGTVEEDDETDDPPEPLSLDPPDVDTDTDAGTGTNGDDDTDADTAVDTNADDDIDREVGDDTEADSDGDGTEVEPISLDPVDADDPEPPDDPDRATDTDSGTVVGGEDATDDDEMNIEAASPVDPVEETDSDPEPEEGTAAANDVNDEGSTVGSADDESAVDEDEEEPAIDEWGFGDVEDEDGDE